MKGDYLHRLSLSYVLYEAVEHSSAIVLQNPPCACYFICMRRQPKIVMQCHLPYLEYMHLTSSAVRKLRTFEASLFSCSYM